MKFALIALSQTSFDYKEISSQLFCVFCVRKAVFVLFDFFDFSCDPKLSNTFEANSVLVEVDFALCVVELEAIFIDLNSLESIPMTNLDK